MGQWRWRIACVFAWAAATVSAMAEGALIWLWLSGMLYVEKYGAADNLYAAEDAWAAGVFALCLLPLSLLFLALSIFCTGKMKKQRRR